MGQCMFSTKALTKPIIVDCQLDPRKKITKIWIKIQMFLHQENVMSPARCRPSFSGFAVLMTIKHYIDDLMQDWSISSALAMEILQSCIKLINNSR